MQVKRYLFCNCGLQLTLPDNVLQEKYYHKFIADFDTPDFSYNVIKTDALPPKAGECIYDSGACSHYKLGSTYNTFSAFYEGKDRVLTDFACRGSDGNLYISTPSELNEFVVFEGLRLPELLLEKGIGILHCSFVEYNGQAIIFAGDKQVGKSTQAALWQKYKGTTTINGDRAGLYFKNGVALVGGVPYCGMSDICENKNMPVKAIICLSKGTENTIKRLSAIEGFMALLGKFSYNQWDKAAVDSITALTSAISEGVPVFSYSCRKDESAVDFLESVINKEA